MTPGRARPYDLGRRAGRAHQGRSRSPWSLGRPVAFLCPLSGKPHRSAATLSTLVAITHMVYYPHGLRGQTPPGRPPPQLATYYIPVRAREQPSEHIPDERITLQSVRMDQLGAAQSRRHPGGPAATPGHARIPPSGSPPDRERIPLGMQSLGEILPRRGAYRRAAPP